MLIVGNAVDNVVANVRRGLDAPPNYLRRVAMAQDRRQRCGPSSGSFSAVTRPNLMHITDIP